jgi:hypothetical protein
MSCDRLEISPGEDGIGELEAIPAHACEFGSGGRAFGALRRAVIGRGKELVAAPDAESVPGWTAGEIYFA